MKQVRGWWFPDEDKAFSGFHFDECERDIPWFLSHVEGRGTVIQAGGAVGMYPLRLAEHFQRVITFEPDPQNWECLQANVKARGCHHWVMLVNQGLAEMIGTGAIDRPEPDNWGANRVVVGTQINTRGWRGFFPGIDNATTEQNPIRLTKIDWMLGGNPADAIWLDVEGMELAALKGAEQTIRAHSPVIVTEENGNGSRYGVGPCDIEDYLATLGYQREAGIGRDRLYRRVK
jgi:FkbM family methyltransferase